MKLKVWELSLLIALALTVTISAAAVSGQRELSGKLVRLHVVGSSDSDVDQNAKLKVRDAVCEYLEPLLKSAENRESAMERISADMSNIERVADAAAKAAGQSGARVKLACESFPTRDYDTFSLPAGKYASLRVTVGEGNGRNWWCVVFPPLCTAAAQGGSVETFGLSDSESVMITSGYTVRFRILDWINELRELFA